MLCWKGLVELRSGRWVIGERLLAHGLDYGPMNRAGPYQKLSLTGSNRALRRIRGVVWERELQAGSVRRGCDANDRRVEPCPAQRALERRTAKSKYTAVRGHEPVPGSVVVRRNSGDRSIQSLAPH